MERELNFQTDLEKNQQVWIEMEAAAQEVLISKEELVALDFRRQKTREGFRALKNTPTPKEKAWLSFGGLFVKTTPTTALHLLEHDLKEIDQEISTLRGQMKQQVNKLRDLEGKPELKGFDLKPLTKEAEIILGAMSK